MQGVSDRLPASVLHRIVHCSVEHSVGTEVLDKVLDFLSALAKLRKATISLIMSVCPSVRTEQLGYNWMDFHLNLIFEFFFENLSRKFISSQF